MSTDFPLNYLICNNNIAKSFEEPQICRNVIARKLYEMQFLLIQMWKIYEDRSLHNRCCENLKSYISEDAIKTYEYSYKKTPLIQNNTHLC